MTELAPILVMVYDRLDCLKKCIESLLQCPEAAGSILFISSDNSFRESDREKIAKVREYISSISGFRKVVPIFHEHNRGLKGAYDYSIDLIQNEFERYIFLEDDIVVSPDFLKFLNEGLEYYEHSENIISISGFSHSCFYDVEVKKIGEVYFTKRWCPWGFATWLSKMHKFYDPSIEEISELLQDRSFIKRLNTVGIDLYTGFRGNLFLKKKLELDYLLTYHMVKNDWYTVTPYSTKSFNIGNDGKGTRTKKNKRFVSYELKSLQKVHPYAFINFSEEKIDNSFNFNLNNIRRNKFKRLLNDFGLLKVGYYFHELRKQWKRKQKKF